MMHLVECVEAGHAGGEEDTERMVYNYRHTWTIDGFSFCVGKLVSSTFDTGSEGQDKWCVQMWPFGDDETNKGFLTVYVNLVESESPEVRARLRLSIVNGKKEIFVPDGADLLQFHNFLPSNNIENKGYGWPQFIRRDVLLDKSKELLADEELTLLCDLFIVDRGVNNVTIPDIRGPYDRRHLRIRPWQVPTGFAEFPRPWDKYSDVTLVVGGKEFFAHKIILASASHIFSAMFQLGWPERHNNRLDLGDVDHEPFATMIFFIYSGLVPANLKYIAHRLLSLCVKYGLERLKVLCEEALFDNLTVENAAHTLIFADVYNGNQLKRLVVEFIVAHKKDVLETAGFEDMIRSHPHLLDQIMRASTTANKNNKVCRATPRVPS